METVGQSAFAGLIAALTATTILGLARYIGDWISRSRDVKYIRRLLIEGQQRVMGAQDTHHKGMDARSSADTIRAAQYNTFLKEIRVALERWAVKLSHTQRKDVYEALDWYNKDSLYATKKGANAVFVEVQEGRWPTTEMSMEAADRKFEKLQSIKWLNLEFARVE